MKLFVQVFDLDKPMSWQSFNRLPVRQQIEYLKKTKGDLGATNQMLGEMFGTHENLVQLRCHALGLNYKGRPKTKDEVRRRWNTWVNQPTAEPLDPYTVLTQMPRKVQVCQ